MRTVILIGGAPTVGKSTIAKKLSENLGLPWISTDQIRGLIRPYARREDWPDLLLPEDASTAETFLTKFSVEEITDMELAQGKDVWPAVKYMIDENYGWEEGVIIEGVNILPDLVAADYRDNENVKTVFLVDEDADRVRDVVYSRGLWDDAETYSDDLKPKEIEWAIAMSKKIRASAEQCNLPCVEVQKNEDDFQKVIEVLNL